MTTSRARPIRALVSVTTLALMLTGCQDEKREFREMPPAGSPIGAVRESELEPGPTLVAESTKSPYGNNAYALSEGKRLFNQMNCSGCHFQGGGGIGCSPRTDCACFPRPGHRGGVGGRRAEGAWHSCAEAVPTAPCFDDPGEVPGLGDESLSYSGSAPFAGLRNVGVYLWRVNNALLAVFQFNYTGNALHTLALEIDARAH